MPTPPPPPPQSPHQPPSQPTSPLPKRPKTMASPSTTTINPPPDPLSGSQSLLVKKLSPAAKTPTRGSAFAAGYDLYSARATTVPGHGKATVETDLAIAVPEGTCERFCFSLIAVPGGGRDGILFRIGLGRLGGFFSIYVPFA